MRQSGCSGGRTRSTYALGPQSRRCVSSLSDLPAAVNPRGVGQGHQINGDAASWKACARRGWNWGWTRLVPMDSAECLDRIGRLLRKQGVLVLCATAVVGARQTDLPVEPPDLSSRRDSDEPTIVPRGLCPLHHCVGLSSCRATVVKRARYDPTISAAYMRQCQTSGPVSATGLNDSAGRAWHGSQAGWAEYEGPARRQDLARWTGLACSRSSSPYNARSCTPAGLVVPMCVGQSAPGLVWVPAPWRDLALRLAGLWWAWTATGPCDAGACTAAGLG